MNGNIVGHNTYERAYAPAVKIKTDETVFAGSGLFLLCVAFCAAFFVSGCSQTGSKYAALAPPPSPFDYTAAQMQERNPITPVPVLANPSVDLVAPDQPVLAAGKTSGGKRCSVSDRFDRDAAIAYHWGDAQRHRMALDVDGLDLGGKVEGVELRYTLRLQKQKTKKERCRYASNWQGLVGSGYHEMVLREDDTVWHELRDIRNDVEVRLDTLLGR